MKKYKKILIVPLLSFLCLNKVYAECSQQEIDEFKKIEDQYTVTYEYDENSKMYTVKLNRPNDKYEYLMPSSIGGIETKDNYNYIITNVIGGEYTFQVIKETDPTCAYVFKNITVNMQKYNKYSESDLCKGNEEFYLCQEKYDQDIDQETFESRIEIYEQTKQENSETTTDTIETKEKKKYAIKEKYLNVINYVEDNLIIITGAVITIIIAIIFAIHMIKKRIKRRRLE